MQPRVSACMVLYHSGEGALETVRCLLASTMPVEVHVVDNSPDDLIGRAICMKYGQVQLHTPRRNLGYGAGNNVVLTKLRSRYHIICNPDVTFDPELVRDMVDYMERHRDIVILTPRVLNQDGTEQLLPRREPRLRYLAARRLPGLGGCFERWRREYTLQDAPGDALDVDYATGCFMLVRTQALYRLKGFDERFFLYHEDSDLSRRALKLGKIVYNRAFCVTHAWNRESLRRGSALVQHALSTYKYFHKWGWRF